MILAATFGLQRRASGCNILRGLPRLPRQPEAEVGALAKRLAASYPETNRGVDATVVPVWAGHLGAQGFLLKPLQILMVVCVLLLIIVCANVANLLLARAVSRQKEMAIRLAFGAGRSRLVRQLLTETLLLAAAGAAVGVLLVVWMGESLNRLLPAGLCVASDIAIARPRHDSAQSPGRRDTSSVR